MIPPSCPPLAFKIPTTYKSNIFIWNIKASSVCVKVTSLLTAASLLSSHRLLFTAAAMSSTTAVTSKSREQKMRLWSRLHWINQILPPVAPLVPVTDIHDANSHTMYNMSCMSTKFQRRQPRSIVRPSYIPQQPRDASAHWAYCADCYIRSTIVWGVRSMPPGWIYIYPASSIKYHASHLQLSPLQQSTDCIATLVCKHLAH